MGQKILVGNISKGMRNDVTAFNVDNDSFPTLMNAYEWRQRIRRKRGTSTFSRLSIYFNSTTQQFSQGMFATQTLVLGGGNLLTGFYPQISGITQANPCVISCQNSFYPRQNVYISGVGGMTNLNGNSYLILACDSTSITINVDSTGFPAYTIGGTAILSQLQLQTGASIVPGSVSIVDQTVVQTFLDDGEGNLIITPGNFVGEINYATGEFQFFLETSDVINASFNYYPALPVLGLEPFVQDASSQPLELGFDQTYGYNITLTAPDEPPADFLFPSSNVSYYNNPATGTYSGYTQKSQFTPLNWNLQNYQQVWTTNYENACWIVPGITAPFSTTNLGMQFAPASAIGFVSNTGTTITVTIANSPLVVGDFVFFNEWTASGNAERTLNFQTGYVTSIAAPNITIMLPNASLSGSSFTPGIIQYLTNDSDSSKDCLRWYNGAPFSSGSQSTPPAPSYGMGFVNFCPPLLTNNVGTFSISGTTPAQYYLVGARMAVPYKDRLLFFGVVIQNSLGNIFYLQDTVVYSQNGTPFYTASFAATTTAYPPISTPNLLPILVPSSQTATPSAWWENATGFGGFITAGYARPIISVSINEDALIVGLSDRQARILYTGNDIVPFNFYIINSELGSDSTFSTITLDRGVLSVGGRGIILTSQVASQRVDLTIPNQIFNFSGTSAGSRRVCAVRDFIDELIYFTYPDITVPWVFPNRTVLYNYREDTWAILEESYTTYGNVRTNTGLTWQNSSYYYASWGEWRDSWNSGKFSSQAPTVICGNAQGFVMQKNSGTSEGNSLYIQDITGSTVTSPNHCLENGDFIIISNCLGTISQVVNGKMFYVQDATTDTFVIWPPIGSGSYAGSGVIKRLAVPFIQTKQFPIAWEMARKTRLGFQQYLFSTTERSQIQLLIYLSQNATSAYNKGEIVPSPDSVNDGLIYSDILYTCPESENLGLTPANTNLQMLTAPQQAQIWHRMNTSLLGDTVQIGFSISFNQMIVPTVLLQSFTITAITQNYPCVITCVNTLSVGNMIQITGVQGMTELNYEDDQYNIYQVLARDDTSITIDIDSSAFNAYTDGGIINQVTFANAEAEVELHAFILDVQPSALLA